MPTLINTAREKRVSAYIDDGRNRPPSCGYANGETGSIKRNIWSVKLLAVAPRLANREIGG
jgi:hypothetical protein